MRLIRLSAIALLGIVVVFTIACDSTPPPPYTHTTFTLSGSNWTKDISIFAEDGKTIEGYFTVDGNCQHLSSSIVQPSKSSSIWWCAGCSGTEEFSPKCQETGFYNLYFSYYDDSCSAYIDLYYRVR